MLTISLKSMNLFEDEAAAKEKLIKLLETEFSLKFIADTVIEEGQEEHIRLYQIYGPKKSNPRGAGRKRTGRTEIIKEYARNNPGLSITQIASHFSCSRQYVSRLIKK